MPSFTSVFIVLSGLLVPLSLGVSAQGPQRVSLDNAVILIDSAETSYVQYGAKNLGSYLSEITGNPIPVSNSVNASRKAKAVIAVGEKMARAMGADGPRYSARITSTVPFDTPLSPAS